MNILHVLKSNLRLKRFIITTSVVMMLSFFLLMVSQLAQAQSASQPQDAQPKLRILVKNTQDRFISFADGHKLYHGKELSFLLNHFLLENGNYNLEFDPQEDESGLREVQARIPNVKMPEIQKPAKSSAQISIQPSVKTLLYASGARSNRVVYGFSPNNINPYNAGIAGGKENEFVVPPSLPGLGGGPAPQCQTLDFFGGSLKPPQTGYKASNFGANFDEGISFSLFGFGIQYKRKPYITKSEIDFLVTNEISGESKTYSYTLEAKGYDLFVGFSYATLSAAVEVQRRKTLREALKQMLPQIIGQFEIDLRKIPRETHLMFSDTNKIFMIPLGTKDNIKVGTLLVSEYGSFYAVTQTYDHAAVVVGKADNHHQAFDGERLRFALNENDNPWVIRMAAMEETSHESKITLADLSSAQEVAASSVGCFDQKLSFWQKLFIGFFNAYGYYRYHNVFDQSFEAHQQQSSSSSASHKIAIVSSGVDPKEKRLFGSLDASGFDFISWDPRPSDDLGTGTAAALLLKNDLMKYAMKSATKNTVSIVPIKVIGPQGEIHSAAIYGALEYLSKREDIEMVIIPFAPTIKSQALQDGVGLILKAKKTVVMPQSMVGSIAVVGAEAAPRAANSYRDRSLSNTEVSLSAEGVGVIHKAAEILHRNIGG